MLDISKGVQKHVKLNHFKKCEECNGTGAAKGTQPRVCEACKGSGRITSTQKKGNMSYSQVLTCPACGGKGKFIDTPCEKCGGTGRINEPERLPVTVPKGANEGMVIKIPGKGKPSRMEGGQAGDLLVIVRTAPDPDFIRDGADLWHTKTIELLDAVLGAKVEIEVLEENLHVAVPPGSQPNAILRVKEKGLPYLNSQNRGNLYVRLKIHIPEILSSEEKELYEKLKLIKNIS